MENTPSHPLVNAAIKRVESIVGGPVACPCCGGTKWAHAIKAVRRVYVTEDDPEPDGEEGDLGSLRTLVLVCRKCSFVRLHLMAED